MSDPASDTVLDPFGALAVGAVAMHEMYEALTGAGFSEHQALMLVIAFAQMPSSE